MLRKIICCVMLLSILAAGCVCARAESAPEESSEATWAGPVDAYTKIPKVHVRKAADGNSKLVETLEQAGTKLTITGQAEDKKGTLWYKVRLRSGKTGYTRGDLLTTDLSEVITPTPAPTQSSAVTPVQQTQAYTRIDKVNVRKAADGGSKLVETLAHAGTKVTITGQAEDKKGTLWYAIRFGSGRNGYVRADLLTTNVYEIVTPAPAPTATVQPMQQTQAYTRIANVNVRQTADGGGKLVDTLMQAGTKVTITGRMQDKGGTLWYAIWFGSGRTGYVRADLLTTEFSDVAATEAPATPAPFEYETQAYTTMADVNVRRSANAKSKLVARLGKAGTKVTITGREMDKEGTPWYAVRLASGKTGYIKEELVTYNSSAGFATPLPSGEEPEEQWTEVYLKDMEQGKQDSDEVCLLTFTGAEIDALPVGSVLGRFTFRTSSGKLHARMTYAKPALPARIEEKLKERGETWFLYQKEDFIDGEDWRWSDIIIFPISSDAEILIEYHWYKTHVLESPAMVWMKFESWWEMGWSKSTFDAYTVNCDGMYFEIEEEYDSPVEEEVTVSNFPVPEIYQDLVMEQLENPKPSPNSTQ